uniref:Uncharacterized protein n=1 Tax=Setaria digitata TaxID=48799 RepID=A0A915PU63_9BILA
MNDLYGGEEYSDMMEIRANRMRISDGLLAFAECMRYSLEEKLARNLSTLNEMVYFSMPYWEKLPDDEKDGWFRRAEAEKEQNCDTCFCENQEKIALDKFCKEKILNREIRDDNQSIYQTPNMEQKNNSNGLKKVI